MAALRVALFEASNAQRSRLVSGLKRAGLQISAAQAPAALTSETLLILGPSLKAKEAAALSRAARKKRPGLVVIAAQRTLQKAAHADAVVPLPLSPLDLKARLPELTALRKTTRPARALAPLAPDAAELLVDPMTGFYLFRHFKELLFVEVKRSRRYGLPLSIGVIGFDSKDWTEDDALRERLMSGLSLSIRRSLRDTDHAVQFSGNRILVLMTHTELSGAVVVSERIRTRVAAATLSHGESTIHPTVSIGLAAAEHGRELPFSELLARAQGALEEAISGGGNRVQFHDSAEAAAKAQAAQPEAGAKPPRDR